MVPFPMIFVFFFNNLCVKELKKYLNLLCLSLISGF